MKEFKASPEESIEYCQNIYNNNIAILMNPVLLSSSSHLDRTGSEPRQQIRRRPLPHLRPAVVPFALHPHQSKSNGSFSITGDGYRFLLSNFHEQVLLFPPPHAELLDSPPHPPHGAFGSALLHVPLQPAARAAVQGVSSLGAHAGATDAAAALPADRTPVCLPTLSHQLYEAVGRHTVLLRHAARNRSAVPQRVTR